MILTFLAADPAPDYNKVLVTLGLAITGLVGALVYVLRSQARDTRALLAQINESHEKQVDKVCDAWKDTADRGFNRIEGAIRDLHQAMHGIEPSGNGDGCHANAGTREAGSGTRAPQVAARFSGLQPRRSLIWAAASVRFAVTEARHR